MQITDVRVRLADERDRDDRIRAYVNLELGGCLVIKDLRVVDTGGKLLMAMPSRKAAHPCPRCRDKNHLKALYCNRCGTRLPHPGSLRYGDGQSKLHVNVAFPTNNEFRRELEAVVFAAYREALASQESSNGAGPEDRTADAAGVQRPPVP